MLRPARMRLPAGASSGKGPRMNSRTDVLVLFSGGLDSILACKVLQDQGLRVLGLHFVTPFFGKPRKLPLWRETYGLDIEAVDVSEEYVRMLAAPVHGWGKAMNPCVDCKILMLSRARAMMTACGAKALASGEVVGQRPMSQRRDALNIISRDAGVRGVLVRPLSALLVEPTAVEEAGFVDRSRLLDIGGRGRKRQLALAREYGIVDIPTPAGGCCLTEPEAAARICKVYAHRPSPSPADCALAGIGRQYWAGDLWLSVGRNESDNRRLESLAEPGDILFKTRNFPGPLVLGRGGSGTWDPEAVRDAAAFTASFSPKAVRVGGPVELGLTRDGRLAQVVVQPERSTPLGWTEPTPDFLREWKASRAER